MSQLQETMLAYQYQTSKLEQFNALIEPLHSLGIKYFCYFKLFKDGRYIELINHESYLKDFFEKSPISPIFREALSFPEKKTYFLVPYNHENIKQDENVSLLAHHDFWNAFCIYEKEIPDYIIGYCFGTDDNSPLFSQFYLRNLPLLERFINYFKQSSVDLLNFNEITNFGMTKDPLPSFYNDHLQEDPLSKKIETFLHETQLFRKYIKAKDKLILLSKRETECLEYLSLGKSMKEIGRALSLSPKTIEFYLKNIKNKTKISTKEELIVSFIKSNNL